MHQVYTIGHSNHTEKEFLSLLTSTKIELLVDIRSNPSSRWAPFANRDNLENVLRLTRIHYLYLGDVLGGHPTDSDSYDPQTKEVDYETIRGKESFKKGISQVLGMLRDYRLCLMCAEEDPTSCHRNLLVAASLRKEGVTVLHIRGDGRIQTDEEIWKEKIGVASNQYTLPL